MHERYDTMEFWGKEKLGLLTFHLRSIPPPKKKNNNKKKKKKTFRAGYFCASWDIIMCNLSGNTRSFFPLPRKPFDRIVHGFCFTSNNAFSIT